MPYEGGIEVKVHVGKYKIECLKQVHDVPEDVPDRDLVEMLLYDLIWRRFDTSEWNTETIQAFVSDIEDRYA